jgi:hypothetical protein
VNDIDHSRVYASDLRKLVQWYNLLISQKALPFEEVEEKEDDKKLTAKMPASKKKQGAKKPVIRRSPSAKKAVATKTTKTTKK